MDILEVELTEEDVLKGKAESLTNCPFAVAIRRQYPSVDVSVSTSMVVVREKGEFVFGKSYAHSLESQLAIKRIDAGERPMLGKYYFKLFIPYWGFTRGLSG